MKDHLHFFGYVTNYIVVIMSGRRLSSKGRDKKASKLMMMGIFVDQII